MEELKKLTLREKEKLLNWIIRYFHSQRESAILEYIEQIKMARKKK